MVYISFNRGDNLFADIDAADDYGVEHLDLMASDPPAADTPRIGHADRAKRRLQMAADFDQLAKSGKSVDDCYRAISKKYNVSSQTVMLALREGRVKPPARIRKSGGHATSTLKIVAELIEGIPQAEIAKKHELTRQRISTINQQAEKAGIFKAVAKRVKAEKN